MDFDYFDRILCVGLGFDNNLSHLKEMLGDIRAHWCSILRLS